MAKHTKQTHYQVIKGRTGLSEFIVVPYNEFKKLINQPTIDFKKAIPSEVAA